MLRRTDVITTLFATIPAVAACGGSNPPSGKSESQTQRGQTALKLAACVRAHRVPDLPNPQSGGGFGIQASAGPSGGSISVEGHRLNISQPAFQHAMNTCQRYQAQGPPISGSQLARNKQGALKMAACMRRHGVPNFPDPKVSAGSGGHGIQVRTGLGGAGGSKALGPQRSPAFQRAMTACQPLLGGLKRRTA